MVVSKAVRGEAATTETPPGKLTNCVWEVWWLLLLATVGKEIALFILLGDYQQTIIGQFITKAFFWGKEVALLCAGPVNSIINGAPKVCNKRCDPWMVFLEYMPKFRNIFGIYLEDFAYKV